MSKNVPGLFDLTSREVSNMAYESVKNLRGYRQQILLNLSYGPQTDEQLEACMNIKHQTLSSGRRALVIKGLVKASGKLRETDSKRLAIVWEITPLGRKALGG